MYNRKRVGPRMEHWGNPALTGYSCEDFIVNASNMQTVYANNAWLDLLPNQDNQEFCYYLRLTLINLHPNQYNQEFCYYLFVVILDRCMGSCNTLNDLSNGICVRNKTEV